MTWLLGVELFVAGVIGYVIGRAHEWAIWKVRQDAADRNRVRALWPPTEY